MQTGEEADTIQVLNYTNVFRQSLKNLTLLLSRSHRALAAEFIRCSTRGNNNRTSGV